MASTAAAIEARVITDIPANARARWHVDDLVTTHTVVDGRPARYASGGRGLPVLFLHGWGLDHRAYEQSLRRLTARGCRVIAPSLPGFGRTAELPCAQRNVAGYAAWVDRFLDAIGLEEPMLVLGHSFGGGIAAKLAHDHPQRVRYLVLLNSVGDPRSFAANLIAKARGVRVNDLLSTMLSAVRLSSDGLASTTVIAENIVRNPVAVLQAGLVAMSANLGREMAVLADRGLPTLVLWSDHDGVIPLSAFDTFCSTFGTDGHVVRGGHSWLLANPDVFGEVLDNVINVESAQHGVRAAASSVSQLRDLLEQTTVPRRTRDRLLGGVSPLWVLSESPDVLAADLALCHPRLRPGEVRAVARHVPSSSRFRLTVVATDRQGLLADTAATLARAGVSIVAASVMTWPAQRLALHAITVESDEGFDSRRWTAIGARLREMARESPPTFPFMPTGRARVSRTGEGAGRSIVRVTAPDRIGLLSAVCRWFADAGISIEAADIATNRGTATDVFLVDGEFDADCLAEHLSGPASSRSTPAAVIDTLLRYVHPSLAAR